MARILNSLVSAASYTLAKSTHLSERKGVVKIYDDLALKDFNHIAVQEWVNPKVVGAASVLAATALLSGTTKTVTTGITQPDFPRCVSIVCSAANTGVVAISGTNINGVTISENITLNGVTGVNGLKAFATITQIVLPQYNAGGDTVSVGLTKKFGYQDAVSGDYVIMAAVAGVKEGTAPTTVSNALVELCNISFNTAISGSNTFKWAYIA